MYCTLLTPGAILSPTQPRPHPHFAIRTVQSISHLIPSFNSETLANNDVCRFSASLSRNLASLRSSGV